MYAKATPLRCVRACLHVSIESHAWKMANSSSWNMKSSSFSPTSNLNTSSMANRCCIRGGGGVWLCSTVLQACRIGGNIMAFPCSMRQEHSWSCWLGCLGCCGAPMSKGLLPSTQVRPSATYTSQVQPPVAAGRGGATLQHQPVDKPEVAYGAFSLSPRGPAAPSGVDVTDQ